MHAGSVHRGRGLLLRRDREDGEGGHHDESTTLGEHHAISLLELRCAAGIWTRNGASSVTTCTDARKSSPFPEVRAKCRSSATAWVGSPGPGAVWKVTGR